MKILKKLFKDEDGQVLVMFALMITVLMGFAALVIDVGVGYVARGELQNAADAAALAGAAVATEKTSEVAESYAAHNGVDKAVEGTNIAVEFGAIIERTEKAYTFTDLAFIENELKLKYNDSSQYTDVELIAMADSDSPYIEEAEKYTYDMIAANSNSKLIDLALENGLSSRLTILYRQTEEVALKDKNKTDAHVLDYAKKHSVDMTSYKHGVHYEFQTKHTRESAIIAILEQLFPDNKSSNYFVPDNKEPLVTAVLNKLNEKQANVGAKITNKPFLIQELVNKDLEEIRNETITIREGRDTNKVKVTVEEYVSFSFARILGIQGTSVSADATAEKMGWAGEALPFINLDGDAEDSAPNQPLEAWNKVSPGDKERISNDDLIISDNVIQVKYSDGIIFKKGKVMSEIKGPLHKIVKKGNIVYLFSLKKELIENGYPLKNKQVIPLKDLVLLKCEITEEWGGTGASNIKLKFLEAYEWDSDLEFYESLDTGERLTSEVKLVE